LRPFLSANFFLCSFLAAFTAGVTCFPPLEPVPVVVASVFPATAAVLTVVPALLTLGPVAFVVVTPVTGGGPGGGGGGATGFGGAGGGGGGGAGLLLKKHIISPS